MNLDISRQCPIIIQFGIQTIYLIQPDKTILNRYSTEKTTHVKVRLRKINSLINKKRVPVNIISWTFSRKCLEILLQCSHIIDFRTIRVLQILKMPLSFRSSRCNQSKYLNSPNKIWPRRALKNVNISQNTKKNGKNWLGLLSKRRTTWKNTRMAFH